MQILQHFEINMLLAVLTAQSIETLKKHLQGTSQSYARSHKISTQRTGA